MAETEDFLEHYGVKGMKWGVKKGVDGLRTAGQATAGGIKKAGTATSNTLRDAIRQGKENRAATKAERKANFEAARAKGYSAKMRTQDLNDVGVRGTRRIEKRIANGEKIGVARFKETIATTARGLAIGTAILATPIAIGAADKGLGNLASSIKAKRGAEAARNLFADNKGLTSYATVALAFDSTQGIWK